MTIQCGNSLEILKSYSNNYFTTIITDPPYGLSFMGKKWDYDVPSIDIWKECLRVLKPGGTMLCFAGSRTQHRMAVNVEDAGFLIKDCLMWLYGSGFPKSYDISKGLDKFCGIEHPKNYPISNNNSMSDANYTRNKKEVESDLALQWKGYGTALKPAYEPIIMAIKPNDGTYAQNALKWGVAGINIGGSRIEKEIVPNSNDKTSFQRWKEQDGRKYKEIKKGETTYSHGRFPANIILDEETSKMLDEQTGILKSGSIEPHHKFKLEQKNSFGKYNSKTGITQLGDSGGASRFFYCAKASPSERNGNHHPTVKPLKLMEYLIKLIMPPKDGLLLDPFAGSGTTILAAKKLGYDAIGIEKEKEYCRIAEARIANVNNKQMEFELCSN